MTRRRGMVTRRHICDRVKPEEEREIAVELEAPYEVLAIREPDWGEPDRTESDRAD